MTPDTKSFSGSYLLFRKEAKKLRRPGTANRAYPPRFRHPSFEAAEAEAIRLLELHPQSTFVILQEVARVKLKEAVVSTEGLAWAEARSREAYPDG